MSYLLYCIDPLFDKQIICLACGVTMTSNFYTPKRKNERNSNYQRDFLRSMYLNDPLVSPTSKLLAMLPSWIHINRVLPILQTDGVTNSCSSLEQFEIDLNASG